MNKILEIQKANNEMIEIEYPPVRQFTMDTGRIDRNKHYVRALLEVDVTEALQKIKQLRSPERKLSFLAWFIKVLAATVSKHPPINGIRKGRNKVVVFKSVDVSTVVEKRVDGKPVPLPVLLRGTNFKTPFEINEEIQSAVDRPVKTSGDLILGDDDNTLLIRIGLLAPQWLRLWVMRTFFLGEPQRMQKMMGTVMVTSLGTVGRLSGWILPSSMHPLSIGIGSLNKKPVIHDGEIQKRDILHLTVSIDHDVIDGMPAMRFVDDLIRQMEAGEGLEVLTSNQR